MQSYSLLQRIKGGHIVTFAPVQRAQVTVKLTIIGLKLNCPEIIIFGPVKIPCLKIEASPVTIGSPVSGIQGDGSGIINNCLLDEVESTTDVPPVIIKLAVFRPQPDGLIEIFQCFSMVSAGKVDQSPVIVHLGGVLMAGFKMKTLIVQF
jgi:hypothetical protein